MAPSSPAQYSPNSKFTKHQKIFLVLFGINSFMCYILFSLYGPLFPPEASLKGLSASVYGPIMSMTCGFLAICSFFLTGMEKVGLRTCYASSGIVSGCAGIAMGLLHYLPTYWSFLCCSVLAFALNGVAIAIGIVSSYLLCLVVFPKRTAVAIGVIEGGFLAGSSFGPILSEVVFTSVGYTGTYFMFAAVQISTGIMMCVALPPVPSSETTLPTFKEILEGYRDIAKFPTIVLFAVILIALETGNDFITAILEPGLRPLNLSRVSVGLMFLCVGAPQLFAPFWGWVLDKLRRPELFLAGCLLIVVTATLILRNSFGESVAETIPGLILYGLGQGTMDVSAVVNFTLEVKEKRSNANRAVNASFTAIVYAFTTGVGGLIGPSVAGVLYDQFGFNKAMLFITLTHTVLATAVIVHMFHKRCRPRSICVAPQGDYEVLEN